MYLGLQKLIQGAQDVEDMKKVLAEEQIKLEVATLETSKMLEVYMYMCIYICIYIYIYMCIFEHIDIYIYIYINK
jgi:hypothetical protein